MSELYRDDAQGRYAKKLARVGDPRGVLAAVDEYELLKTFGYAALYGTDWPADARYVARTRLVMAGLAHAQQKLMEKPAEGDGTAGVGSGGSGGRTVSSAVSEGPRQRRSVLDGPGAERE